MRRDHLNLDFQLLVFRAGWVATLIASYALALPFTMSQ
jgi:hypothetical protein